MRKNETEDGMYVDASVLQRQKVPHACEVGIGQLRVSIGAR
jgi:hypothetical protein